MNPDYQQANAKAYEYEAGTPDKAPGAIDDMNYALNELSEVMARLEKLLHPVLNPSYLEEAKRASEPMPSVAPIREHLYRIHAITTSGRSLLDRIDL